MRVKVESEHDEVLRSSACDAEATRLQGENCGTGLDVFVSLCPVCRRRGFRDGNSGPVPRQTLPSLQKGDRRGDMLPAVLRHRPLHGDAGQPIKDTQNVLVLIGISRSAAADEVGVANVRCSAGRNVRLPVVRLLLGQWDDSVVAGILGMHSSCLGLR